MTELAKPISKLSKDEAKELLQKWREENVRCPEKVREIWYNLNLSDSLGDEKWPVIEQVCLAALDLQDAFLIKECLLELDTKFPNSSRVKRLKAMAKLEMRDRHDEALKLYDEMIKKDETNSLIYKRKIAILISQDKIAEAIRDLCEYLKKFLNDTEAWSELCDLYIQEQEYVKAAFCMEELILSNPHNYVYYLKYAEIQYTINSSESIELAKSYFSQAFKLNCDSLRALYGIYLSSMVLSSSSKISVNKQKEHIKTASWALDRINEQYEKVKTPISNEIDSLIDGLENSLKI